MRTHLKNAYDVGNGCVSWNGVEAMALIAVAKPMELDTSISR